jgi:hypothetical protein
LRAAVADDFKCASRRFVMTLIERVREKLVIGVIAIFIGFTVYTMLGLAWSFKLAVEAPQKLLHYHR